MLSSLVQFSLAQRLFILLATLIVAGAGWYAYVGLPIDAFPDVSSTQVKVIMKAPGMTPEEVETRLAVPVEQELLGIPHQRLLRSTSKYALTDITLDFEDGTDIYWARSRVLEYVNSVSGKLPKGVTPTLGPDATGVGWVYQYAVLAKDKTLAELRTIQDWYVRYQLTKAHGVAEVASIGGFVQTYQVTVDPLKLRSFGIPLMKVSQVIRDSNRDVGGRVGDKDGVVQVWPVANLHIAKHAYLFCVCAQWVATGKN